MKYIVNLNGKSYEVEVDKTEAVINSVSQTAPAAAPAPVAAPAPAAAPVAAPAPAPAPVAAAPADGVKVCAPMPGTILAVNKTAGESVNAGDIIVVLEAMKMENEIVAPTSGTLKQVLVQKGESVDTDAVIAVIG